MAILYTPERVNASKVLTSGLSRKLLLNYVGEGGAPFIPYIIPIIYTPTGHPSFAPSFTLIYIAVKGKCLKCDMKLGGSLGNSGTPYQISDISGLKDIRQLQLSSLHQPNIDGWSLNFIRIYRVIKETFC